MKTTSCARERRKATSDERGFTILQVLVTIALIVILSAFAIVSISASRSSLALQGSVRQLAGYLEKSRLDAVRRHSTANVTFTNTSTYSVTMDFTGGGVPTTRNYTLDPGVTLISTPLPNISYNWRGRTSSCTVTFAMQNSRGEQTWVDVSDSGDVTVNSDVDVLPTVSYATVSTTSGIVNSSVVSGSTVHNNTADCNGTSGGAGPPVTGGGSGGCTVSINPSSLSIRKNGGTTGTVTISSNVSGTLTTSGPINLQITPATQAITAGGSVNFSIISLNNTRGTFAVNFGSACTTVTLAAKVTN